MIGHQASEVVSEARFEAAPVVALVVFLEIGIAVLSDQKGWGLWVLPWWVWLVLSGPMLVLAVSFALTSARESRRHRRLAFPSLRSSWSPTGLSSSPSSGRF